MKISKTQRKQMEDLIYKVFSALDPSGVNTDKYKSMFSGLSDQEFEKFFDKFFKSDDYFILDVVDYERDLTIDHIEKAAAIMNVPLFERVIMPHVNMDKDNPVVTQYEVPVGYVHKKRTQQTVTKKNTTSTEIAVRSALTGQVTGKDKNARDSDSENFSLTTLGANNILRELLGPRADDMVMKSEMYASIAQKGFVSLDTLTNDVSNKITLNALDAYLIGMGLKSDLVTDGYVFKKSLTT